MIWWILELSLSPSLPLHSRSRPRPRPHPLPRHRFRSRYCSLPRSRSRSLVPFPGAWVSAWHIVLEQGSCLTTGPASCLQSSLTVGRDGRDGVACGMAKPVVKQKKLPPETHCFYPLHQIPGLVEVFLRLVLHPSSGQLLNKGLHLWVSLTARQHCKTKKGVGSGERVPILVVLALDCVGEIFSCEA